jgi:hypothetical protein
MGYAVYHLQKSKASAGSIGHHIDRTEGKESCYKHADPTRKHLNQEFAKSWKDVPLQEAINQNIKNNYKGKKEIRKDAVKYITHILTGTNEDMHRIFKDKTLANQWISENAKFIKDNFGLKNIVRFTLHLDEKTPHIHCVTTAITEDGRLSAKELVGNNKRLEDLQTDYAQRMEVFGLKRGLKSSVKHVDTKEFYKFVQNAVPKDYVKNKHLKEINKTNISVKFAPTIAQILDNKEISPFGIKKAKEELKTEITAFVEKTFENAKKVLKEDLEKKALAGFNQLEQVIASDTALIAQEQKKVLDKIRFREWEKIKNNFKSPEETENKVLNKDK